MVLLMDVFVFFACIILAALGAFCFGTAREEGVGPSAAHWYGLMVFAWGMAVAVSAHYLVFARDSVVVVWGL